jgi:P27 family predicted phage terminase small subunit
MGRPAKSEAEHNLHGTQPHPTTVKNVSDVPAGVPKFSRLPRDERKVAKRICGWLRRREHLTEADYEVIQIYAAADVRYHRFKDQLDSEGWTIETDEGPKTHPAVRHFQQAESVMLRCLDELGLTPAARDRIKRAKEKAAEAAPVDPMEALLQRHAVVPFVVPAPQPLDADIDVEN